MAIVVGCDFHSRFMQLAVLDQETGVSFERKLEHREAEEFYAALCPPVVVVMESTGYALWFELLLQRLGHELVVGNAARLRAMAAGRPKTDRRDAQHLLRAYLDGRFPAICSLPLVDRDARHLLWQRHRLVQTRTRVKNQLQALAMSHGLCCGRRLWSATALEQLRRLPMLSWAGFRRDQLLQMLTELNARILPLDTAIAQQVEQRPEVRRLMTHPGVGPLTALAWVLIVGNAQRFANHRCLAAYLGLVPREYSSGGKQRLGHISKQGNAFMRFLLVEAAQTAARHDPELRRHHRRLLVRKGVAIAKVAVARRLAVRLYLMSLRGVDYPAFVQAECSRQA